jgi:excisionase family DNA binding protein
MGTDRLTMSVHDAARALGISASHAYELIRTERLPAVRLGRRIVVPTKALHDFLGSKKRDDAEPS